jgi:hypothetical protein
MQTEFYFFEATAGIHNSKERGEKKIKKKKKKRKKSLI